MTEAEGPTTHQWINPVTETTIEANPFTRHRLEIEVNQNFRRRKQQMTQKLISTLLGYPEYIIV
jgi:hypothetical protein